MPHLIDHAFHSGFMFSPVHFSGSKYPPLYHPGTPKKDRAVAVPLVAGDEKRVDFQLQVIENSIAEGINFFHMDALIRWA
jgi:hypothetical protein